MLLGDTPHSCITWGREWGMGDHDPPSAHDPPPAPAACQVRTPVHAYMIYAGTQADIKYRYGAVSCACAVFGLAMDRVWLASAIRGAPLPPSRLCVSLACAPSARESSLLTPSC